MTRKARLNSEERKFFILITKAILSNPFLDEHDETVLQILYGVLSRISSLFTQNESMVAMAQK